MDKLGLERMNSGFAYPGNLHWIFFEVLKMESLCKDSQMHARSQGI